MGGSITTWYFRVFLVGSRSYSVIIGGSDTINGVSGRFRYVLPYLRVFLEGSRSYNVITGGSNPRDSGIMFSTFSCARGARRGGGGARAPDLLPGAARDRPGHAGDAGAPAAAAAGFGEVVMGCSELLRVFCGDA